MIVYVTRPDNHEIAMGGWRRFALWTEKPDYHHIPVDANFPDPDGRRRYQDKGWCAPKHSGFVPFKPLAKQSDVLSDAAWALTMWACAPKSANVPLDQALAWSTALAPAGRWRDRTNFHCMLMTQTPDSDAQSRVHYRRFLMEVNLATLACRLVAPKVFFYDDDKTIVETMEIEEPYRSRRLFTSAEADAQLLPF